MLYGASSGTLSTMPGGRSAANTVRYTAVALVRLDNAREALEKPAVSDRDITCTGTDGAHGLGDEAADTGDSGV